MNRQQELVATRIAAGMFSDFCNPENQGYNFTWADCPKMIARLTQVSMFAYFRDKQTYDVEKLKLFVENMVTDWIERAGFKDGE